MQPPDETLAEPCFNISVENLESLQKADLSCISIIKDLQLEYPPKHFIIQQEILYNNKLHYLRPVVPKF